MAKTHNHIPVTYTVTNAVVGLADLGYTPSQIAGAIGLVVTPDGGSVRYLGSGTPTTSFGHIVADGKTEEANDGGVADLKFIRDGSVDAVTTFELDTFVEV